MDMDMDMDMLQQSVSSGETRRSINCGNAAGQGDHRGETNRVTPTPSPG